MKSNLFVKLALICAELAVSGLIDIFSAYDVKCPYECIAVYLDIQYFELLN